MRDINESEGPATVEIVEEMSGVTLVGEASEAEEIGAGDGCSETGATGGGVGCAGRTEEISSSSSSVSSSVGVGNGTVGMVGVAILVVIVNSLANNRMVDLQVLLKCDVMSDISVGVFLCKNYRYVERKLSHHDHVGTHDSVSKYIPC